MHSEITGKKYLSDICGFLNFIFISVCIKKHCCSLISLFLKQKKLIVSKRSSQKQPSSTLKKTKKHCSLSPLTLVGEPLPSHLIPRPPGGKSLKGVGSLRCFFVSVSFLGSGLFVDLSVWFVALSVLLFGLLCWLFHFVALGGHCLAFKQTLSGVPCVMILS